MALPPKYQPTVQPILANDSIINLAGGFSTVKLYGCRADIGSASYFLTTDTPYSDPVESSATGNSIGDMVDLDFDFTPFNRTVIVKGKAVFTFSTAQTMISGTGITYPQAIFRKWDGSSETDIATVSGSFLSTATATRATNTLVVTIPETVYKPGEQIRVTLQNIVNTPGGGSDVFIAHDPQNRAGTTIVPASDASDTTQAIIQVPFKVK